MSAHNICTKDNPWNSKMGMEGGVQHPDAVDIGECVDGCCDKFECPNCGTKFLVECAQ